MMRMRTVAFMIFVCHPGRGICDTPSPPCPGGWYEVNDSRCEHCSSGKYSTMGSTSCTQCPPGSICGIGDTCDGKCIECPGGTHSNSGSKDDKANTFCEKCASGFYSNAGASECTACPAGYKCGMYDKGCPGGCIECPAGTHSSGSKDDKANTFCEKCASGFYSNAGASECTACPAGYKCGMYDKGCPDGCIECPGGTHSNSRSKDNNANSFCEDCATGFYSNAGASECTACRAGYKCGMYDKGCPDGCIECPEGTTSNPGDRFYNPCSHCIRCTGTMQCYNPSQTAAVNRNLIAVGLNNSCAFLFGCAKGLLHSEIAGLKTLAKVPTELGQVFDDWHDIDWRNGQSIAIALKDSTKTAADVWKAASALTHLPDKLENGCEAFVATVAPELVVTYEGGKYLFRLFENSKDVTEHVAAMYNALSKANYESAGDAFGRLIEDGLELREGRRDLHDKDQQFVGASSALIFF